MRLQATRAIARLVFAALSVVLIAVAFLRGNYLLGADFGVAFAGIAAFFLWLFGRFLVMTEEPSLLGAALVVVVSIPVGYVMTYPATINPDVQHFINKQADDRTARAELRAVFASDRAFRRLWISTVHVKVVNVTIHGSLNDRSELDRLRERIAAQCDVGKRCPLHWDVVPRESGERIKGLDHELFDTAE